ncbi:MAG TPA: outer membrane beta-barrel protein [Xanthobacteraceae bacterium]|nr:outer membrane beta-barrel protein [Xanthobacteraceae bacterium]
MKKQLLYGAAVGALTLGFGGTSFAAPPPIFNWSGFYFGGHVGWGQAEFKGTWFGNSVTQPFTQHPSGFLGGLQFGQLWQQNTFVYGWEADVSFMDWKKTGQFSDDGPPIDTLSNRLSLLASLRMRLGVTIEPRTFIYFTAGPAFAQAKGTAFDNFIPSTASATFSTFGDVVGIGAELAQANNWTWRLEGLYYYFFANKTLAPPGGIDTATDKLRDVLVVRIALNYKFGP